MTEMRGSNLGCQISCNTINASLGMHHKVELKSKAQ